jgi:hypothetical protein
MTKKNKNKLTIKKLSQKEHDKLMNDPTIIKVSKKDMDIETLSKIIHDLEINAMISGKAKIEIVD